MAVKFAKQWLPHDYVLWRGLRISQALLYCPHVVLWCPEGGELEMFNMDEKRQTCPEELGVEVRYFTTLEDLIQGLVYGYVNVVYMPRHWWLELLARLPDIWPGYEFLSLFIDELDDIVPPWPKGKLWHRVEKAVQGIEDFRKALINFVFTAQQKRRLYYGVRDMTMYRIYLPGASKEKDKDRVPQSVLDHLQKGHGVIARGTWEPIKFRPEKPVRSRIHVALRGVADYTFEELAQMEQVPAVPSLRVSITPAGVIDAEEVLGER